MLQKHGAMATIRETIMLVLHTLLHFAYVRRTYPVKNLFATVARSSRVLLHFRDHKKLLQIGIVRHYLLRVARNDLFHHLSHRNYLANFLTQRERIDMATFHVQMEDRCFDNNYKQAVYLDGGLCLWEQNVDGIRFHIQLRMAPRVAQEGDLEVALFVDDQRLHSFKFTWLDGARIHQPGQMFPWVTCCQGLRRSKPEAPAKFAAAFPNSWPKLFCMAALRGVALANGSEVLIGLPGHAQAHAHLRGGREEQFTRTYDEFWRSLHGEQTSRYGYLIPARLQEKDLNAVPSKHRKRAETRRRHWLDIEQSASEAIRPHLTIH